MKSKKTKSILWGIGIITVVLLIVVVQQPQILKTNISRQEYNSHSFAISYSYNVHDPIDIFDDSGLNAVKSSGFGNVTHPYIIEGHKITTNATSNPMGIAISGTTAHFIIQNCLIETGQSGDSGIYILNVADGTATIKNNICTGNGSEGILVYDANNATINNNICYSLDNDGIQVISSQNSVITNNTCHSNNNNGIYVSGSDSVVITENNCSKNMENGMKISNTDFANLTNNICVENRYNGFTIGQAFSATISNNTVTNNEQEGISIYFSSMALINNNTCNGKQNTGLSISKSPDSNITNNYCSGEYAITIYDSENCLVANNTCVESVTGIFIGYSTLSITIVGNSMINCGFQFSNPLLEDFYTHTISNNSVNGFPLGFLFNMTDTIITDVYGQLILINCNSTSVSYQDYSNTSIGIALYYCYDCDILNNLCKNAGIDGILIRNSNSTTLANNRVSGAASDGIEIFDSPYTLLDNNTCVACFDGFDLWKCPYSTFINNTAADSKNVGMKTYECQYSIIINNIFMNCGLRLDESNPEDFFSYIIANNSVNGLPLGYFENITDFTVNGEFGQLILINCNSSSIRNQNYSNATIGIQLYYSKDSEVYNNTCNNGYFGIIIGYSPNTNITNNECSNNFETGLAIGFSSNINVVGNICNYNGILHEEGGPGIAIYASVNLTIFNNTCNSNSVGFFLGFDHSVIANNTCNNNVMAGIQVNDGYNSLIANNTCINNGYNYVEGPFSGISCYNSDNNTFFQNNLLNNAAVGLELSHSCNNNTVYSNKIGANGDGTISQAFSSENDNHWNLSTTGNLWSDYNGTGNYPIETFGPPNSFDYHPFILFHQLSAPSFIFPKGGETLLGVETVKISPAFDSYGHDLTYTFGYSCDGGTTLNNVTSSTSTEFAWDTTSVENGSDYQLYIIVEDGEGLANSVTLNQNVTIGSPSHALSTPTIISPNGGEILSDTILIQWTSSVDSLSHSVMYTLSYSLDGSNWIEVNTGLTSTSYNWDTTTVSDSDYHIKVTAICSIGLSAEDTSDDLVEVKNDITTSTTTTTDITSPTETTTTTSIQGSSPGFELIMLVLGLSGYLIWKKNRK